MTKEGCTDEDKLRLKATEFFVNLYTKDDIKLPGYNVRGRFPKLSNEDTLMLANLVMAEEVKSVVFDMGPNKALESDGVPALFYQSQWEEGGLWKSR